MKSNTYQNAFYAALRNRFKTLFNRYKVNVVTDGGTVRDDSITKAYMQMAQNNRIADSIKFSWLGEAGIKQSAGRVSKLYGLQNKVEASTINATQQTVANQPYLSGNIAPNERYCLKNPNGGSNYMTHPTISFGAADAWSVTTVLNWNGSNGLSANYISDTPGFAIGLKFPVAQPNILWYSKSSNISTVTTYNTSKLVGKTSIITVIREYPNINFYIDGIFVYSINEALGDFRSDRLFGRDIFNGKIHAHIIRSQALTQQQVTAEYNLLRSYYPEIPNVTIGTQQWTTSNFEAVCTPQGTIIPEIQANANVEKISPVSGSDFSVDNFWFKAAGVLIADGVCHFNNVAMSSGINKGGYLSGGKYKVTFSISNYISGGIITQFDGNTQLTFTGNGTYVTYVVNSSPMTPRFVASTNGTTLDIDNVSIQEIGWSGSQELYDGIYSQTEGTTEQKTYAAVKAAAMWCHYNNDVAIGAVYGKLYNWFAVKLLQMDIDYYNAAHPTTPYGWRVPTQAEFQTLSTYLGGDAVSGGHLKEAGLAHWNSPNTGADNSSGFTAIPNGLIPESGGFSSIYARAYYWSISELSSVLKVNVRIFYSSSNFDVVGGKDSPKYGFAIRLIKS